MLIVLPYQQFVIIYACLLSDFKFFTAISYSDPTVNCIWHPCHNLERYPLQVRQKQDWGRGFILLLPQAAIPPGSDAGSDVIKPASSFVI